jgi:hypothetical protein
MEYARSLKKPKAFARVRPIRLRLEHIAQIKLYVLYVVGLDFGFCILTQFVGENYEIGVQLGIVDSEGLKRDDCVFCVIFVERCENCELSKHATI